MSYKLKLFCLEDASEHFCVCVTVDFFSRTNKRSLSNGEKEAEEEGEDGSENGDLGGGGGGGVHEARENSKESMCSESCTQLLSAALRLPFVHSLFQREGRGAERDSLQQMAELCSAEVRNSPLA